MKRLKILTVLRFVEHLIFPPKVSGEPRHATVLRAIPIILVCTCLTFYLHHQGLFRALENPALDTLLRVNPIYPSETIIVRIDDQDFHNDRLFAGTSPLKASELAKVITAIAAGKPRVIAIDLDTSDKSFARLQSLKFGQTTLVWARNAEPTESCMPAREHEHASRHDRAHQPLFTVKPFGVLGSEIPVPDPDSAVCLMTADPDGMVRSYPRIVKVCYPDRIRTEFTFPWQVVQAYDPKQQFTDNQAAFHFIYDPNKLHGYTASQVLQAEKGTGWQKIVQDKIVLLGGTYRESRDMHVTPVGAMYGVELCALAIETHLQDREVRPIDDTRVIMADIISGLTVVAITCMLPASWALFLTCFVMPAVAVVASFLFFSKIALWVSFVPLMFGIYLHLLYDHIQEDRHLRQELAECREKLRVTETP